MSTIMVTTPAPCPYCGMLGGTHVWAGSGQCPGSQPDRKDQEIAQLKALIARAADALEDWHESPASCRLLIVELRKAAG